MSDPATLPSRPALVIAIAPTGARKTKRDHPKLPISPAEIAAEAEACMTAGAAMIHLHVRDAEGGHTLDAEAYRPAIAALRDVVGDDLVVQMTTEAVGRYAAPEQIEAVRALRPEAVSVSIAELIPDSQSEADAGDFFAWLAGEAILPQYILYSPEEIVSYAGFRKRGIIPDANHSVLFVLGRYAADQRSSPTDLLPFVEAQAAEQVDVPWMVCAFGEREGECMATAISLGGHARVGFENNQVGPDGKQAGGNADAVTQAVEVARMMGRSVADAEVARGVLGGTTVLG